MIFTTRWVVTKLPVNYPSFVRCLGFLKATLQNKILHCGTARNNKKYFEILFLKKR